MQQKSRKFQLTINNPKEHGYDHEAIRNALASFKSLDYWCMCDEVGEQGTPHTHIYLYSHNAILFDTVFRRFHGAHIEPAKGTHRENRDYIRKEGKWLDDCKHETSLIDTFEESGDLPDEQKKQESLSAQIVSMVEDGFSNTEIIHALPGAITKYAHIEAYRQALRAEEVKDQWRDLTIVYLWGKTGVGKTRSIMEKYGYSSVYRVTNYKNPFDGYNGQDVILFDEFRSSLPISDMLKYLEGYPVNLPARYADKPACFTKVFLVSNIPPEKQYTEIQADEPETYRAFMRRFLMTYELSEDMTGFPFEEVPGC